MDSSGGRENFRGLLRQRPRALPRGGASALGRQRLSSRLRKARARALRPPARHPARCGGAPLCDMADKWAPHKTCLTGL
uniref:Uncharacterized protein n=1 Tax=Setaria italica TaxID=4555 RepID=K3YXB4_SETIT